MKTISFEKCGINFIVMTTVKFMGVNFQLVNTESGWNTNVWYKGQRWYCPQVPSYCFLDLDEKIFRVKEGRIISLYNDIFISVFLSSKRFLDWQHKVNSEEFIVIDDDDIYDILTKGTFEHCIKYLLRERKQLPGKSVRFLV